MTFVATTGVLLYVIAMALIFGGTAALSFATAPATFRTLPAYDAGRVFGKILRVFDAMGWVASMVALVGAVVAMAVEVTAPGIALCALAGALHVVYVLLRRSVAPKMAALKPPETARFDALHGLYVRLYTSVLFLSLAGLVLAVLRLR
jgi:hypothetical protein